MSIRQMLLQLQSRGWDVRVLGATIFDNPRGFTRLKPYEETITENRGEFIAINDQTLTHYLLVTESLDTDDISQEEMKRWCNQYSATLNEFRPDLVFFYGGGWRDAMIPYEARVRGIPSAAYLVNENYTGVRWARDVDALITDSYATKRLYSARNGISPVPVGKFIVRDEVVPQSPSHGTEFITFINPALSKGGGIVAALAYLMEQRRPDIKFQIVQSRGDWATVLEAVSEQFGAKRTNLKNVVVRENTADMASVYATTRVLVAPSLWYESGARVLAEAMLNGIPAIVSDYGGNPEMIGAGGIKVRFPENCHQKPYNDIPKPEVLAPIIAEIESLFDDEDRYRALAEAARHEGNTRHDIETSTDRLVAAFEPFVEQQAGDGDIFAAMTKWHKQKPADPSQFGRGSVPWLISKERQYGGRQSNVVRRRQSDKDPRSPEQFSAGYIEESGKVLPKHIGGDRMGVDEHGYAPAYSSFLKPFYTAGTTAALTVVEVGILRGHGLAIWCDLFPDARVIGLDLDPDIFGEHRPILEQRGAFQQNTPEVYAFDQFDPDTDLLSQIATNGKIDIFIDDGAHTREVILGTLDAVKDHMSEGAVYIIEDFVGIDTEVRERLPGWRVLSHGLMTVATNLTSGVPDYVPSIRDYLSGALDCSGHKFDPPAKQA